MILYIFVHYFHAILVEHVLSVCVIQPQHYAADRRTGNDCQRELHLARRPRLHELLRQQQGN